LSNGVGKAIFEINTATPNIVAKVIFRDLVLKVVV